MSGIWKRTIAIRSSPRPNAQDILFGMPVCGVLECEEEERREGRKAMGWDRMGDVPERSSVRCWTTPEPRMSRW